MEDIAIELDFDHELDFERQKRKEVVIHLSGRMDSKSLFLLWNVSSSPQSQINKGE